ncbi:hypothetical protein AMTR_s00028p00235490 [Amborella trichopoda]|uniref:Uncharacterized protein n=1 Tax=Amborella trichopoda TaxID=13333 RepID=W1PTS1_AMBTC|nr:hypothetical protein AMTR_s00028p00235490 [Amborella trichopoda]
MPLVMASVAFQLPSNTVQGMCHVMVALIRVKWTNHNLKLLRLALTIFRLLPNTSCPIVLVVPLFDHQPMRVQHRLTCQYGPAMSARHFSHIGQVVFYLVNVSGPGAGSIGTAVRVLDYLEA